jgi:hypothetical protein
MSAKYDIIGIDYAELRKPDQRIARIIESALGSAQAVLNADFRRAKVTLIFSFCDGKLGELEDHWAIAQPGHRMGTATYCRFP